MTTLDLELHEVLCNDGSIMHVGFIPGRQYTLSERGLLEMVVVCEKDGDLALGPIPVFTEWWDD